MHNTLDKRRALFILAVVATAMIWAVPTLVYAAEKASTNPARVAETAIATEVGGNLGLGLMAGGTWGFLVYLYKKIIENPAETKFDKRRFLTTLIVGIAVAIIVDITGLDWNQASETLATFGILPYIDKLVSAFITAYEARKAKGTR